MVAGECCKHFFNVHFEYSKRIHRCGIGRKDTKTVDAVDECCKTHDACYENIFYLSVSSLCLNGVDTAEYKACMCDKTAAQCFAASTYNSSWKGVCQ